jgi:acetyltransferase-like isoleucine patch superfamily enzyme
MNNIKYYIRRFLSIILIKIFPELRFIREHFDDIKTGVSSCSNVSLGKFVKLDRPYRLYNCVIGDYSYISLNSRISEAVIGRFCSIGPNFICGWGIHALNGVSTSPIFYSLLKQTGFTLSKTNKINERKKIFIGNDVFIGMNVTILDGVSIGDGAVIGAGAVVVEDIPPYAVAVGIPAKIKKYRFDEATRELLLKIKWWDNDIKFMNLVEENLFDVSKFIEKATSG